MVESTHFQKKKKIYIRVALAFHRNLVTFCLY